MQKGGDLANNGGESNWLAKLIDIEQTDMFLNNSVFSHSHTSLLSPLKKRHTQILSINQPPPPIKNK